MWATRAGNRLGAGNRIAAVAHRMRYCRTPGASALDHVDREATARGFLVLVLHVAAGVAHG
ncbi:MAG TPA: hypothetical protein VF422_10190, partial [Dokdonella sp.]